MIELYYWIGFVFTWMGGVFGMLVITYFFVKAILDWLGKKYKFMWIMVEFAYYRHDFKEWVKDKERIKIDKKLNVYNFEKFWHDYHFITNQKKTHKELSKALWDKTINLSQRKKAFDSIKDYVGKGLNAYAFLTIILNNYD